MAAFFLGLIFFSALQLGNTAPAFHFPLAIELIGLTFSLLLLFIATKGQRQFKLDGVSKNILIALVTLLGLQVVRTVSSFSGVAGEPVCQLMPGLLQKIECVFQMEASALPGPRQLTYSLTAGVLFAAVILSERMNPRVIKMFIGAGLTVSSAIALMSLLGYYGVIQISPLSWLFVNEFGPSCMFMQNPSWIWPWCSPWLAYSAWQLISQKHGRLPQFGFLASFFLLLFYALSSTQRGAVLQILVVTGVGIVSALWFGSLRNRVPRRAFYLGFALALCASGVLVASFFLVPETINTLMASVGLKTKLGGGGSSLSHERLEMWQIAWSGIKESFWLGHGQGSWTREFAVLAERAGRPDLIFDTAHNFFVQSFFELGMIHSAMILIFFTFILGSIWVRIHRSGNTAKKTWFIATCAAYLVILLVQELDFIRSSFYQHAIFFGFVLGTGGDAGEASDLSKKIQISENAALPVTPYVRMGLALILTCTSMLFVISLLGFSLAGYQYEANSRNGFAPKVRWLGSFGTLNFVLPRADQENPVARFKILKSHASEFSILTPEGWKKTEILDPEKGDFYLDIPAHRGFGMPSIVKFNGSTNSFGRNISVLVEWPPQIIEGKQK